MLSIPPKYLAMALVPVTTQLDHANTVIPTAYRSMQMIKPGYMRNWNKLVFNVGMQES